MMIRVSGLTVRLDGKTVVRNASLEVGDGEKVLLLGPNGSGKTTLVRAILGLVRSEGSVAIDGTDPRRSEGKVSVTTNLPEVYYLLDLNLDKLIDLYASILGGDKANVYRLIGEFELRHALGKKIWKLSSGEQKLVLNLMALALASKHVVLDEPFENVDPARRSRLAELIASSRSSVLMITHELSMLRKFRDWGLYFIVEGRVYGRLVVEDLLGASIIVGERTNSLVSINIGGKTVSIVKGEGYKITSFESLDKLYELVIA